MRVLVAAALSAGAALAFVACGGDSGERGEADTLPRPRVGDAGPIHVHGLGVNPSDGALFVATHTGLFRAAAGETGARRVADRFRDTMGFSTPVRAATSLMPGRLPSALVIPQSKAYRRTVSSSTSTPRPGASGTAT